MRNLSTILGKVKRKEIRPPGSIGLIKEVGEGIKGGEKDILN